MVFCGRPLEAARVPLRGVECQNWRPTCKSRLSRGANRIWHPTGVEADVDAVAGGGERGGVAVYGVAVECVERCDVRGAAVVSDALRDFLEGGFAATGEVDVRALAGVGSR